jgi:hypothetical protein
MNTQNTSHELRALNATEVDAVSGAAAVLVDMGLFGRLTFLDGGCATWHNTTFDGNGGWTTTTMGQCPKP